MSDLFWFKCITEGCDELVWRSVKPKRVELKMCEDCIKGENNE